MKYTIESMDKVSLFLEDMICFTPVQQDPAYETLELKVRTNFLMGRTVPLIKKL